MSKELIGSHSVHETLMRQTQIDAARIEELERDLLNLVCRIHRDGGHYIAKYGEAKAIADADTVAAQNNADLDALQADRDEWKARAEFSYRQRDELEREIERKMSAAAFVLKERDAMQADNARLREALENCRLLAARHRKEEWAGHVLRLCESAGVAATALRSPK